MKRRPTETGAPVKNWKQALGLFKMGAPMHPIFVHFTIALTSASLAFDALGFFFSKPSLTAAGAWTRAIISTDNVVLFVFTILLWITFLIGFVGLGMHLRGFGRQMGGLYVIVFNWLEGPPAFAPALFTGFAGVGLITAYFL